MKSPVSAVANLATLIHLARHGDDASEWQGAVVLFRASLGGSALLLEASISALWANGRALHSEAPGTKGIIDHLLVHDVGSLEIPPAIDDDMLTRVVRALSAPAGTYLTFQALADALGTEAVERVSLRPTLQSPVVHDPPPAAVSLDDAPEDSEDILKADSGALIMEPLPLVAFEPQVARGAESVESKSPEHEELRAHVEQGRTLIAGERWDELLDLALTLAHVAINGPTEPVRQLYRVELRRLVSRRALRHLARFAGVGERRQEAAGLMRVLGDAAAEVLMDLLVEAESISERRGYYGALAGMPDAGSVIQHHLTHPIWYVVRNAADLCGDLDLTEAIPELSRQIHHPDDRVRRSVAGALAKLGTAGAMEPIRHALVDRSAPVRLEALMHLDGRRRGRSLSMILSAMLETEQHPEVRRETLRALGRIGTADAVQAIARAAEGESKMFRKRKALTAQRVEAVRALTLAGRTGLSALRALADDGDPAVSAAAREGLAAAEAATGG